MSAQVFTLPDLGEGLTEAELVRWLVADGDTVGVDQPVAEVETAKAVVEVPSPYAGTVLSRHGAEGETLRVGEPLVSVGDATEAAGDAGSGNVLIGYGTTGGHEGARRRRRAVKRASAAATPAAATPAAATPAAATPAAAAPTAAVPADAPASARPSAVPAATSAVPVATSAADGAPGERRPVQSPVVRRLARDHGIDLATVEGTGPGGMVLRHDVAVAAARAAAPTAAAPPPAAAERATVPTATAATGTAAMATAATGPTATGPTATGPTATGPTATGPTATGPTPAAPDRDPRTGLAVREVVPLRGVRRAVAETLTRSRAEIPEATTWVDVDATDLLALRQQLTGADGRPVGLLAILARFVVAGLARFPELNARVDTGSAQIVHLDGVHLGIAAQTDRGLVVPSVADAHRLGMRGLDTEIRRLTAAARDGSVTAAELTRGSFTLNNYGVLGVDGSAAIINHPEVAMLGVGRVLPRPWVVDGAVVPRSITQLSLVFDHRVCDGGTAGGFLRFVADAVESPLSALADL
ncbi:Dihydrolipoamide acyltransferase component of branched-chain alpha-keto acid dehydrogenase complex [Pseudonocardia sp. Ae406_Ps2]|uniref:dihydrolipoamide acetyltransferase family protein n=1 Tax=unclassified Pseudonocardia TaxID=2619320 RepID=UPI00094B26F6|nr:MULTISPECIES: dihydrolipoamide acetyltransferase family protein [unclassified Pseudonocardia]OLL96786.1 Dihydrolipoamide acyltransferase component of branched-chain alpha-keto acid dehydrogenase complex [Pseudonocardia sp. Ae331_Ps2]OLM05503.1 Dihydrolipoamide acyltransferase component of branched-chain alpha-keto acid dehydrogenase complex [Pseudonocardia sp. Ae406_Ps2]OLM27074.1 Dihydrolipoamide acyltransferase component of branched-chain alpha-keto acid dehydrogenase complex [Pseudonocardi